MKEPTLKPCPFCGGKAYIDVFCNREYICCHHKKNCVFEPTGEFVEDVSIRKQINAWNRRAKDGEQE